MTTGTIPSIPMGFRVHGSLYAPSPKAIDVKPCSMRTRRHEACSVPRERFAPNRPVGVISGLLTRCSSPHRACFAPPSVRPDLVRPCLSRHERPWIMRAGSLSAKRSERKTDRTEAIVGRVCPYG